MRHLFVVFCMTLLFWGGGQVTGFSSPSTTIVSPQTGSTITIVGLYDEGSTFSSKVELPDSKQKSKFITIILMDKMGIILKKKDFPIPNKGEKIFIGSVGKSKDVCFMSVWVDGQLLMSNSMIMLPK